MRKSFDNTSQVVHVWAQRRQEEGKAGNVSFDKDTLYSYRTPIAHFMEYPAQDRLPGIMNVCVLHSTDMHSVSTTRHQSLAYRSTSQYARFKVPHIGVYGGMTRTLHYDSNAESMHVHNMTAYSENYLQFQKRAYGSSANTRYHLDRCDSIRREALAYAQFFSLDFQYADFPAHDEAKLGKAMARAEKHAARLEEVNRSRNAHMALSNAEKIEAFLAGTSPNLPYNWNTYCDGYTAEQVKDKAASNWRSGAVGMPSFLGAMPTMLRLQGDTIYTSHGAQFPASDAVAAWEYIKRVYELHVGWTPDGYGKLGAFQIDRIDNAGTIYAGCHTIARTEVELMARTLGLVADESPVTA